MRFFIGFLFFVLTLTFETSFSKVSASMDNVPQKYKKAMSRCARCHNFDKKRSPRTGPSLHDVMGRKIGSLEDFRFSKYYVQIGNAGDVWDEKDLMSYLKNNKEFLQKKTSNKKAKGRMNYNVEDKNLRKEIIEFLKLLK